MAFSTDGLHPTPEANKIFIFALKTMTVIYGNVRRDYEWRLGALFTPGLVLPVPVLPETVVLSFGDCGPFVVLDMDIVHDRARELRDRQKEEGRQVLADLSAGSYSMRQFFPHKRKGSMRYRVSKVVHTKPYSRYGREINKVLESFPGLLLNRSVLRPNPPSSLRSRLGRLSHAISSSLPVPNVPAASTAPLVLQPGVVEVVATVTSSHIPVEPVSVEVAAVPPISSSQISVFSRLAPRFDSSTVTLPNLSVPPPITPQQVRVALKGKSSRAQKRGKKSSLPPSLPSVAEEPSAISLPLPSSSFFSTSSVVALGGAQLVESSLNGRGSCILH